METICLEIDELILRNRQFPGSGLLTWAESNPNAFGHERATEFLKKVRFIG
jgi:hypothetical protein